MARVLLISYERDALDYLSAFVARCGCEVCTAADKETVLTKLAEETFQMIIVNIELPDAGSPTGLHAHLLRLSKTIPVIMIASTHAEELRKIVTEDNIRAVLSAPFELGFIRNMVRDLGAQAEKDDERRRA